MSSATRVCASCGERKLLTSAFFYRNGVGRDGKDSLHTNCIRCELERGRWKGLYRLYGVTKDDYLALLEAQEGVCKICASPPAEGKNLYVDHCHSTSRIRGLLCMSCNVILGHAKDSVKLLTDAIAYLSTP
jgi:hypothetical protein